ncbi:MAG: bifunctional N-acetylglucosamine-1-phosphate uridyltransferase/glucosamine-1-phosphate acetyltransferase [Elusimicrobia bacterium]|nr:bifunctional N-acetylglucosamine-1-phosphate uridyltransferase/glucosamine-1-phosphate acetyltransferase [Elusimicrobiota bacterium]
MKDIHVVVLAAGEGTRMVSRIPKALHPLAGRPILSYVLATAFQLKPKGVVVVCGQDERVKAAVLEEHAKAKNLSFARQAKPLGTAHALACCRKELSKAGMVLVIAGDVPLISRDTLEEFLACHMREHNKATCLSARLANPAGYGRIVRGPTNVFLKIVEEKDASLREIQIHEVNSGIYLFDKSALLVALSHVRPDNAKKEYYLTDVLEIMRTQGHHIDAWLAPNSEEILGINTRIDLARAESVLQRWTLDALMPYSHLRPGTRLAERAKVGNFTEIKEAAIGEDSKVPHLSYVGDADVGARCNIGCGTITCNYDGVRKNRTIIESDTFVGSNVNLIAPLRIGKNSLVAAGSTITRDVPPNTLAIARSFQIHKKRNFSPSPN